ncbi:hypothetical protein [Streptomyces fungicidicus]
MNVSELLRLLQTEHDDTAARVGSLTTFNEHAGKVCRVRDLHEHLGLPTDEPSINVTRSRLGRLARQGLLEQPGRGRFYVATVAGS